MSTEEDLKQKMDAARLTEEERRLVNGSQNFEKALNALCDKFANTIYNESQSKNVRPVVAQMCIRSIAVVLLGEFRRIRLWILDSNPNTTEAELDALLESTLDLAADIESRKE